MTELARLSPRSSSYATSLDARKGALWVLLYCLHGKVTVTVEGIAEMPFDCSDTQVKPKAVEIEIVKDGELEIRVEPGDGDVVWALTLAQ